MTNTFTYSRAALVAALAACALLTSLFFASASQAALVRGSSSGVTATMQVGTHHPTVGRKWPLKFTAKRGKRAAKVTVTYEYLYGGKVVAVRAHHTFTGSYDDALIFPSSAVHEPLTFRAVISAGKVTINLDYPIEVVQ